MTLCLVFVCFRAVRWSKLLHAPLFVSEPQSSDSPTLKTSGKSLAELRNAACVSNFRKDGRHGLCVHLVQIKSFPKHTWFRKFSLPLLHKHSFLTHSPGLMSITQYCRDYRPPNPPSLLSRHRFTWRNKPLPPPDVAFSLTERWGFKICRCQPPLERFISIFETKFH